MKSKEQTRREFFRRTSCAALGAAAFGAASKQFGLMTALAQDSVAPRALRRPRPPRTRRSSASSCSAATTRTT